MPEITVIVLAYNRPALLAEALASVRAQIRQADEVIVVDDHSDPPLVADGVRMLRQPRNLGPAAAAARGVREAKGDRIAFLNDDDVWAPDFLAALDRALAERSSACVAFCDHAVIDVAGREQPLATHRMTALYRQHLTPGLVHLTRPALIDQSIAAASFALAKRDALNPELIEAGGDIWDYFVCVSLALTGQPGVYVEERLGWYRETDNGVTARWTRPQAGVAARARSVAAYRLALRSPISRGGRVAFTKLACRAFLGAVRIGVRRRSASLLFAVGREFAGALLSPTRPPRHDRGSATSVSSAGSRVLRSRPPCDLS
jgi:glycosyltransferase involved in cell wall biosynthesis